MYVATIETWACRCKQQKQTVLPCRERFRTIGPPSTARTGSCPWTFRTWAGRIPRSRRTCWPRSAPSSTAAPTARFRTPSAPCNHSSVKFHAPMIFKKEREWSLTASAVDSDEIQIKCLILKVIYVLCALEHSCKIFTWKLNIALKKGNNLTVARQKH